MIPISTGATIEYVERNPEMEGIPVIAVHGMLGTGETHLGHVLDWLAGKGYRVLAPTMRGYGKSLPKPRDFPKDFYRRDADDLLAWMDALEIEKAHLIGYSDGGEITLMCAGLQPERFASAATWGAVGYFGEGMRRVAQRSIPGSAWLFEDEMSIHGLTDANAFAAGWVRSVVSMIDRGGDVSLSLAPQIECPVLIMLGHEDTLNPAEYAERFISQTKNGRLVMFDCAHPVHDEQTQIFYKVLGDFLDQAGYE
ncbi:hypothetical protein MASR2M15_07280 [Anaerolineales bacterium]